MKTMLLPRFKTQWNQNPKLTKEIMDIETDNIIANLNLVDIYWYIYIYICVCILAAFLH